MSRRPSRAHGGQRRMSGMMHLQSSEMRSNVILDGAPLWAQALLKPPPVFCVRALTSEDNHVDNIAWARRARVSWEDDSCSPNSSVRWIVTAEPADAGPWVLERTWPAEERGDRPIDADGARYGTALDVDGLASGATYTFTVVAVSSRGVKSDQSVPSNPVMLPPPDLFLPSIVHNVAAAPVPGKLGEVKLTWDAVPGAQKYVIRSIPPIDAIFHGWENGVFECVAADIAPPFETFESSAFEYEASSLLDGVTVCGCATDGITGYSFTVSAVVGLLACGGGGSSSRVGADTSAGQPVQYSNEAKSTLGFIGEPSDASEPVIAFGTAEHDAMPRRCVNHFPLRSGGCVF